MTAKIPETASLEVDVEIEIEVESPHVAKVGVVDAGHNVTSAFDEPVNGLIADLADGDA